MPCYLGDFSKRGWERFRGSNRIKKGPQDRKNDKPPKLRERVKETTTHVLLISSSFIQGAGKGVRESSRGNQDRKTVKNSNNKALQYLNESLGLP